MKTYEKIKAELSTRCKNTRGFNKAFYTTFCRDINRIREIIKNDDMASITALWEGSETHNTYLYKHNSGAYCEFLSIFEEG